MVASILPRVVPPLFPSLEPIKPKAVAEATGTEKRLLFVLNRQPDVYWFVLSFPIVVFKLLTIDLMNLRYSNEASPCPQLRGEPQNGLELEASSRTNRLYLF